MGVVAGVSAGALLVDGAGDAGERVGRRVGVGLLSLWEVKGLLSVGVTAAGDWDGSDTVGVEEDLARASGFVGEIAGRDMLGVELSQSDDTRAKVHVVQGEGVK